MNKEGNPRECLVALGEAKDKQGGGAKEIIETLTKHELNLGDLCFQSYDYAANMSGNFNGEQKKLQDQLGRSVPYKPCLTHRSNTAVEHSCIASPIIKDLYNVLEEIYVFFTGSTKRMTSLEELLKALSAENMLML